ncbi:MAG: pH regulation protein D [Bacteroidales bacterium]|nr:pH regulation protein D [Bacteroidales bacterium]
MDVLAPVLIPITYIVLALLTRSKTLKQSLAVVFSVINFLFSLYLIYLVDRNEMVVSHVGSWPAPFGIVMVADRFSALMLLVSSIVFLATTIYSTQAIDSVRKENGYFLISYGILAGVNGSFMAGDLFNLYVWFEVMLMGSFILVSFGGEKLQLQGAIKYLILNLISSFFFLAGIAILYGKLGTLNMADISLKIAGSGEMAGSLNPALVLFIVGFAIKAALFPFFFWLPASYHTPPPAVSALFAGLLTKVGVYALIRIYALFLFMSDSFWNPLIMVLGVSSMVVGVLTATSQFDFRKILSFHIISQVGYMVTGLAFFTVGGIAAAIFFLAYHMITKTNIFLVAGWVQRQKGTLDIRSLGDTLKESPWWSAIFFVSAFSLAGLPPLSGFAGKFNIIRSGIEAGHIFVAMIALFVGFFTLFSMVKIWMEVFWKPAPQNQEVQVERMVLPDRIMMGSAIFLGVLIIAMGLFAVPVMEFCSAAATDLLDTEKYYRFILGVVN